MDLRQLRHLIAIIEKRSFSAAAKAMNLTQPALTRSMNALEASVGAALLVRKNNGIEPTPAGALLYEYANLLTTSADHAKADIARLAQGMGGVLNVGIGTHIADLVMPAVLSRFAGRHPHLSVNVTTGAIEDLLPMVLEGKVEFAASMVPADRMQQGLAYERIYTTLTYVYAASDHKLAGTTAEISHDDLVQERWVALNHRNVDIDLNRFFANGGAGFPRQMFRTDSMLMMRAMIEQQGCVGIMPVEYMAGSATRTLRVEGTPVIRSCGLLSRPDVPPRPIVVEFADALRTELARMQQSRALPPTA